MPFIDGKFYMNPAYGRALERSRAASRSRQRRGDLVGYGDPGGSEIPESDAPGDFAQLSGRQPNTPHESHDDRSGRWVTIDGHHVLIHEAQGKGMEMEQPSTEEERYLTIVVLNETGGLSPSAKKGPGSAEDLHRARIAVAEISKRLREQGHPEQVAPGEGGIYTGLWYGLATDDKDSIKAWNDSVSAAQAALSGSNTTRDAGHFRLDAKSGAVPSWARGRTPSATFGPFRNAGGGDASSTPHVYVYR